MTGARLRSRLVLARWAIETFPPQIKSRGVFHAAVPSTPAHWILRHQGCHLWLTCGVVLLPGDTVLSHLLDIWVEGGRKVLSISWAPDQPWAPPYIGALHKGDWMQRLGWPCDS